MSQFQTLQFSMTLDRWRRERERDQLYAGADGGLRPLPLGRGSAWRPLRRTVSLDAYERISSPSTLHAAARLAFLAFCMVQIDIYTGKTQLLDSNIKIVALGGVRHIKFSEMQSPAVPRIR